MRIIGFTKFRVVCKALIVEGIEIFRVGNTVFNDESRHSSPACLCPYGLYLQLAPLADIEQWLNDTDFPTDSLPVEEVLVFLSGKVNQDAIIRFNSINQDIRKAVFPKTDHILSRSAWQFFDKRSDFIDLSGTDFSLSFMILAEASIICMWCYLSNL